MERRRPHPPRRPVRGTGGCRRSTAVTRFPGEPGKEDAAEERWTEGVGGSGSGKGGATSNSTPEGTRRGNREQRRRGPPARATGGVTTGKASLGTAPPWACWEDSSPRKHRVVTCCATSLGHTVLRGARQVLPVTVKFLKLLRHRGTSIITCRVPLARRVPAFVNGGQGGGGPARRPGAERARASCVPQLTLALGPGCGQPVTIVCERRGGGRADARYIREPGGPSTRCGSSPPDEEWPMGRVGGVPERPTSITILHLGPRTVDLR